MNVVLFFNSFSIYILSISFIIYKLYLGDYSVVIKDLGGFGYLNNGVIYVQLLNLLIIKLISLNFDELFIISICLLFKYFKGVLRLSKIIYIKKDITVTTVGFYEYNETLLNNHEYLINHTIYIDLFRVLTKYILFKKTNKNINVGVIFFLTVLSNVSDKFFEKWTYFDFILNVIFSLTTIFSVPNNNPLFYFILYLLISDNLLEVFKNYYSIKGTVFLSYTTYSLYHDILVLIELFFVCFLFMQDNNNIKTNSFLTIAITLGMTAFMTNIFQGINGESIRIFEIIGHPPFRADYMDAGAGWNYVSSIGYYIFLYNFFIILFNTINNYLTWFFLLFQIIYVLQRFVLFF